MVQAEGHAPAPHHRRRDAERRRWTMLVGAMAGLVAVCAVAVITTRSNTANLVDRPNELYMDSMKVANKILSAQKFKKADAAERKQVVKSILASGHEHKSGKKVVSKVATIVANTHLSYHQRMEAMKKLLDDQTDAIKQKPLHRVDEPKHAAKKVHSRGRSAHTSKAQKEADDNKKAIAEGAKLLAKKEAKEKHHGVHGHYLHSSSSHDKKVHEESKHTAADPAKANAWMKKQLGEKVSSEKTHRSHAKAAAKAENKESAKAAKALKEGEKLVHETVKRRLEIKHKLHMSAKDEAIKKASEKTAADPKKAHKWISKELAAKKDKAHVKQLASHKKASSHETKSQKLVEWAERHGMPKKLAENPKDKQKVKDIIARMKADLMVEKIKAQFKHDDDSVGGIIHSADPAAAAKGV